MRGAGGRRIRWIEMGDRSRPGHDGYMCAGSSRPGMLLYAVWWVEGSAE